MSDMVTRAAESIVRGYEETQQLLPLAGGVARPIEECRDHAVILAVAHLAAKRAESPDSKRLRDIADFMDDYGFGRGDHNDGPHVRTAADELDRLRAELARYSMGAGEADQWQAIGRATLDSLGMAPDDPEATDLEPTAEEIAAWYAANPGHVDPYSRQPDAPL